MTACIPFYSSPLTAGFRAGKANDREHRNTHDAAQAPRSLGGMERMRRPGALWWLPVIMKVVVRTHGGLGNQLFQLFYARLYGRAHSARLFELHDLRYAHAFARSNELAAAPAPSGFPHLVSALRLPKLATRTGLRRDAVTIWGTTYLDGYFQHVADYAAFDDTALREELLHLREELGVAPAPAEGTGVHLRLGDFFTSEADVTAHLAERLARIPSGAAIVTNDEQRLATPQVAALLRTRDARVVTTSAMSAEQVLRTLAGFAHVDGNDSTLLFWASVLSGMDCAYRNPELRHLRDRFLAVLRNSRS